MHDWKPWLEVAGLALGVLVALFGVLRMIAPALYQRVWQPIRSRITTVGDLKRALIGQAMQLEAVLHELTPNSGGSMRDEVRSIGRQVRQQGALMRVYSERSDEATFELDAQGKCTTASDTFLRWVERSPEAVHGFGWVSSIAPTDSSTIRRNWNHSIDEEREYRATFRAITSTGNEFAVDCITRPIRDPDSHKLTGWLVVWRKRIPTGVQPAMPPRRVDED